MSNSIKNVLLVHSADIACTHQADTLEAIEEIKGWIAKLPEYRYAGTEHFKNADSFLNFINSSEKPDVIFNLVETIDGTDAKMHEFTSLLDSVNVPYTGCKTQALLLGGDKLAIKNIFKSNNLPTPDYLTLEDIKSIPVIDCEYIVKSSTEHGSLGMDENSIQQNKEALLQCITKKSNEYAGQWFAEKYIEGREISSPVLEMNGKVHLLPTYEIIFEGYPEGQKKFLDYAQKWVDGDKLAVTTSRKFLSDEGDEGKLSLLLKDISAQCCKVFSISGYARIDYRIDDSGNPWIIDVNTNPHLSSVGGFLESATRVNVKHEETIYHILKSAEK